MNNNYIPLVVQVVPLDNYTVYVYFDDGKITCYDISHKLDKEIYKPLQDIEVFKSSCTILNNTLAWDLKGNRDTTACIDIDVFTLYELPAINQDIA